MTYLAFARKYRPRSFEDLVGQDAVAGALRTAVATERTAPVYLFAGSHGVGKTSAARILAKALNCPQVKEGRPCLTCEMCVSIDRGEAMDVIEIDAASNRSVDDAERLREATRYRAQAAKYKVYILDEVHQLSRQAFDALLKTFEESPAHARFILCTTELHKVPTTIRSRSQVFNFRRASRAAIEARLAQVAAAEGIPVAADALAVVARRARGSMRDANKMLDQVVSLGAPEGSAIGAAQVTDLLGALPAERMERVIAGIARGEAKALLVQLDEHLAEGGRAGGFCEDLQDALRGTLYVKTCGADSSLLDDVPYDPEALAPAAQELSEEGLLYGLQLLAEVEVVMRTAREPRVVLEVALVRLARASEMRPLGEVLARLEQLEHALGSP